MLEIDNLDFSYGNFKVLKKINIDVEKKSFIGIIGPNGSGKSTLLKNISRILEPESGVIYIDSQMLNEYKSKDLARKLAVVPQDTTINFDFSVYDLIMMGRNPYQDRWGRVKEEDIEIVEEAMDLTDTTKFRDKNINELSGGEKQRVIIARALAQKPEVLLLDEPTSSLDINYQGEIFDLLSYLNRELSLTIITVSHDLNLTGQYCDKLILLHRGQIYATGSAEEVLTEEVISDVYQTKVIVKENPLTDRPYVTLIPQSYKISAGCDDRDEKIHIVCGGGTGKKLMEKLCNLGFDLSTGVLNQGDSDWETARKLNIDTVEIPPFVSISEEKIQENRELMKKADYILVADTPFGHGNLSNLKLVSELEDKKIILQDRRDFSERDYTGGNAKELWNEIISRDKSGLVNGVEEILEIINQ
uniref:Iron compound ABC transporter ATP binding protein n=1 Tax=uncultured organism TaxID=155900 RepID=M1PQP7_9ZZZZ|nr:iron compound ABC transporter ATP binding protein [uncultured organism]